MALLFTYKKGWQESAIGKLKIKTLVEEAKKKNINYDFFLNKEEFDDCLKRYKNEDNCISILTNLENEFDFVYELCGEKIPIINAMLPNNQFLYKVSSVYENDEEAIINSLEVVKKMGCNSLVALGLLSKGRKDNLKIQYYKKHDYSKNKAVFDTKSGRIIESLNKLFKYDKRVDAIICSNDFQAIIISKIFELIDPTWNKKVLLMSWSNSKLSMLTSPSLTTYATNIKGAAKEIIHIYNRIIKYKNISAIQTFLKTEIIERESTSTKNPIGINFSDVKMPSKENIRKIISNMQTIEKLELLLIEADKTDYHIIYGLMKKLPRTTICNHAYCSLSTIKYRINNYKKIINCDSIDELSEVFNNFIDPNKLIDFL